jgi:putative oxidoreductase
MSDKSCYSRFNNSLTSVGSNLQSAFLLLLRLYFGIAFIIAGFSKLQNIHGVADFFGSINIPFPVFNAYVVSIVEFVGGICLVLGLGTRLAAIFLGIVMIVAMVTAHYDELLKIFVDPQSVITLVPFVFFIAVLIAFIFGPGKASLDYFITKQD